VVNRLRVAAIVKILEKLAVRFRDEILAKL
jgi:hypothetical protein